jgi:hypothetical protein
MAISLTENPAGALVASANQTRHIVTNVQAPNFNDLGATLVGTDDLTAYVAHRLAAGGISRLALAGIDIAAAAWVPLAKADANQTLASLGRGLKQKLARINPAASVLIHSHGSDPVGPLWLRCRAAESDVLFHSGGDVTAKLVNRICYQQVRAGIFANFCAATGVGQILVVIPRGGNLQYREACPPTRCRECVSTSPGFMHSTSAPCMSPIWFKKILLQYVEATLRDHTILKLNNGFGCIQFRERKPIGWLSPKSVERRCDLCC